MTTLAVSVARQGRSPLARRQGGRSNVLSFARDIGYIAHPNASPIDSSRQRALRLHSAAFRIPLLERRLADVRGGVERAAADTAASSRDGFLAPRPGSAARDDAHVAEAGNLRAAEQPADAVELAQCPRRRRRRCLAPLGLVSDARRGR